MDRSSDNMPDDAKKEMCAVQIMRLMLEKHSEKHGIPFEEDLFSFSSSPIYETLFDYDTGVWREGPDYLENLYEDHLGQIRPA